MAEGIPDPGVGVPPTSGRAVKASEALLVQCGFSKHVGTLSSDSHSVEGVMVTLQIHLQQYNTTSLCMTVCVQLDI